MINTGGDDEKYPTELVTVEGPDGGFFLMEVRDRGGMTKVSGNDIVKAEELTKSIRSISKTVVSALKEISPDKFKVEFSVEASFEAGKLLALLCNGGTKANLKVILEWEKEKPQPGDPGKSQNNLQSKSQAGSMNG